MRIKKLKYLIAFGMLIFLAMKISTGYSQELKKDTIHLLHGAHHTGKRLDAEMVRWRGYGLGQFIHWGVYSILEGEWQGKPFSGAAEWIRSWNVIPSAEYDSLYKRFNPKDFDSNKWAAMAKQMGAKYVTITTKHHDGFCLWPSQYTHYTIANTPYKKDIIGPIVDAYTKAGIDVILYFSIMDWNNPDWRYDLKSKEDTAAFDRFKVFTKNQLSELLKNYPQIKGLWFDGTWDNSWKKSGAFSDSLEQYLKTLHPGLIIGSRLRADEYGKRGNDSNGKLMGDYEQGWERKIPKTYADVHGNDWEGIMTFGENGWGYSKKWLGHWKTANELLEMLAQSVSLGGNFVLNFGPKADGTFRPEEVKAAKEIGDWMKVNNQAIYNCEFAGWEKQDWGYYTKKTAGNKVYMLVYNLPVSGNLKIKPPNFIKVEKAYFLTQPQKELSLESLDYGASYIHLPDAKYPQPFVIVLEGKKTDKKNQDQKTKT